MNATPQTLPQRLESEQARLPRLLGVVARSEAAECPGGPSPAEALFAHAAVGLGEITSGGLFVRANAALCQMLERTPDEVIGASFASVTVLDDVPQWLRAVADAVATGEPASLDLRFERAQGRTIWTNVTLTRLEGPAGQPCSLVVTTVDLTERRLTETWLRESEDRCRRAMEIETVGIYFFRTSGNITDANDAFLRMTGYARADLDAGRLRWDDLTPAEWMPVSLRAMEQLKTQGNTSPYEKEFVRRDGTRWWALLAACRLGPDEAIEYAIDITDSKVAEHELRHARDNLDVRVQERTAELEAVAGALRDEILDGQRTEMARQELLRRIVTAQEEERRRLSRELHDEIGQLVTALLLGLRSLATNRGTSAAVEKLHELAESIGREVHEIALRLRPTALDDLGLARTLANYVDEWSHRTRIAVDFHSSGWAGERLPSHLETTLYRIVQEALTNVVKHAGATRVSVILERQPDQVITIVEDNGRGFDAAALRAATSLQRLGVVGMEERAGLVDGRLKIESTPNGGTTVFVRIPLPRQKPELHA